MNAKKNTGNATVTGKKRRGRPATHGAYASLATLDGRTQLARGLRVLRQELTNALGGNPSVQESLLIDRAVYKTARIHAWETATLNGADPSSVDAAYLAWANSLRLDLQALGLERRAKPLETLREYLSKRSDPSDSAKQKNSFADVVDDSLRTKE